MTDYCPHCGEMDNIDCNDMDVQSAEILTYHTCGCGASWTVRWSNSVVEDLEIDEDWNRAIEADDIEADDNNQRAADMNATLRDIGGTWI